MTMSTQNHQEYKDIQKLLQDILGETKFTKFFPSSEYTTPRDFRISIVCLIETQDYTLFQSEPHRIDKVAFPRGIDFQEMIERAEAHESKIKQEIRRVGKRLQRKLLDDDLLPKGYDITTSTKDMECHIPDCMCGQCRDCLLWGFAARRKSEQGDEQGRPSKVDVGTAFTIRAVDELPLIERIWNAVDEANRKVNQAFGDKEQIPPQVFLPYVIDLRDGSFDEFLYLLYSILNAKRVGAGRTKYGSVEMKPVGIYFAYEQLFTNKRLVQNCYDYLWSQRSSELDENKKRLGWLGELSQKQAIDALLYAIDKELEKAFCWYRPIEGKELDYVKSYFENLRGSGSLANGTSLEQSSDTSKGNTPESPSEKLLNLDFLLDKAKPLFRDEEFMKQIVSVGSQQST